MRTLLVLLVAVCLAAPALAILPSPFIGGNLQVNSPTGKFSQTDIVNKEGGAKTGVGGELDLGISAGTGELYAGYRFGKNNAKATYTPPVGPSVTAEGDWKLNRFVIGARWHLFGSLPITPTIGGGITLGKTELNIDAAAADTTVQNVAQTSSNKMGWFLEAGGLLHIPTVPVSVLGDIQYHRFNAKFDTPTFNGAYDISFFTFQLGLQYSFIPI
jgi:opacity protein-like surface antigen